MRYRFTLEWSVPYDLKDFATGAERINFNGYAKHIYCPSLTDAMSRRDWHVGDYERWLPKDAYRGTDPAHTPGVSDIMIIDKP